MTAKSFYSKFKWVSDTENSALQSQEYIKFLNILENMTVLQPLQILHECNLGEHTRPLSKT